ncbi:MAG: lipocalin family protein [Xanthomonadales bacterium]|nr:lipocalin family protein [Xanthomonadales bacterium]
MSAITSTTILRSVLFPCLALLLLAGCATTPRGLPPIDTVDQLDVDRFQGQWYVIANIPYFAERGNVASRVIYRERSDGRMDDLYYYRKAFDEEEKSMEGLAWIPDPARPGELKTRFFWPFTFDYLVIKLDPDYRYLAVAHPSRRYAWIMAREPEIPDEVFQDYLAAFSQQGYDASRILKVPQKPDQLGQPGFQG